MDPALLRPNHARKVCSVCDPPSPPTRGRPSRIDEEEVRGCRYLDWYGGVKQKTLAKRLGVGQPAAHRILTFQRLAHPP